MLIRDLTHKQLSLLAAEIPSWVAFYHPEWMTRHRPEWVAEHKPELLYLKEVPADVQALLQKFEQLKQQKETKD